MEISVIIPTHNRCQVLARCLDALAQQESIEPETVEIIVIDDGSTDSTSGMVKALVSDYPRPLHYLWQETQGPAAARNRGIEMAQGQLVLIINDDTIAAPDLLAQHFRCHAEHPDLNKAVQGLFLWSPELEITPHMRWAARMWFKYDPLLSGQAEPDYSFFYTCNVSLKRKYLLTHGMFDEDFGGPAWEDTELGYRLEQQGMKIIFCKEAVGYHAHPTNLETACRRAEMMGRWTTVLAQKMPPELAVDRYWPTIARWPGVAQLTLHIAEPLACRLEHKIDCHVLYKLVTSHYLVRGMDEGVPEA